MGKERESEEQAKKESEEKEAKKERVKKNRQRKRDKERYRRKKEVESRSTELMYFAVSLWVLDFMRKIFQKKRKDAGSDRRIWKRSEKNPTTFYRSIGV